MATFSACAFKLRIATLSFVKNSRILLNLWGILLFLAVASYFRAYLVLRCFLMLVKTLRNSGSKVIWSWNIPGLINILFFKYENFSGCAYDLKLQKIKNSYPCWINTDVKVSGVSKHRKIACKLKLHSNSLNCNHNFQ